jgi:hypothetical protein
MATANRTGGDLRMVLADSLSKYSDRRWVRKLKRVKVRAATMSSKRRYMRKIRAGRWLTKGPCRRAGDPADRYRMMSSKKKSAGSLEKVTGTMRVERG